MSSQSNKQPILILTSAFGEGHNAAARNLALALGEQDPDRKVVIRDLFAEAYGPVYKVAQKGYFFFINHFPKLWGSFYKFLDKDKEAPGRVAVYKRASRLLRKTVVDMEPAVIVSTYPGYNHLLDHLHGSMKRPFRTVTIVTDSISINSLWYSGHSDLLLVPNDATAAVIEKAGIPREILKVTGFPVPPIFEELRGQRMSPGPSCPPKVLYLVNPGQKNALKILQQLGSVEGIELSAACGRDEELRTSLQKIANSFDRPIKIEGWLQDLPERIASNHLVIAKAGGATVQECLAAATPLVMSQVIPGQEEGNAELLSKADCGCTAITPQAVGAAVRHAFSHGAQVWNVWEANANKTGTPDGARNAAREVLREAELRSD